MSLALGTRLGPYEITALIGAGGMGEVYRAMDTNLKRSVAIKVLPESVAGDRERLARFQREAEVLAALNHPHIAAIYGVEKSDGQTALVMELVDGPTLADRIAHAPIPIDEALPIARQIAEALEAAHEQGIIHRDLKPANIKVRPDGTVKVLDFGLAKALGPESTNGPAGSTSASMSPTITSPALTEMGLILGTAAYMSPEQAKGRAVDKRADIWAFGAVLYEMLTGQRVFEGSDVSEVLAGVIKSEPRWDALPHDLPPVLGQYLRRCLQKDPRQRIHDIADVRLALDGAFETSTPPPPAAAPVVPRWRRVLPWAVGAVGMLVVGATAWMLRPELPTRAVVQFSIPLPEGQSFTNAGRRLLAMSSDGASLVYVANNSLYLRRMSGLEPHLIPGSASSASRVTSPAISPDGQSVAFYDDHALKRLALVGGVPVTICPASNPLGLSWDASGIVFGQYGKGILRVSADGGVPQVIVTAGGNETLSNPQVLPGGQAVLFSAAKSATTWDTAQVQVQSLDGGARKTLVENASDGRYLPTGHLVYAVQGVLLVAPFDLGSLSVTGAPVPLVQGVARSLSTIGGAQYTFSQTGALAFEPGPVATASSAGTQDLVIVDRQGKTQPVGLPPGAYGSPRVSPDGKFVAFHASDTNGRQVWIDALGGGTAMRQLTFTGHNQDPIWSPDGKWVAFQSDRDGDQAIFRKRADGSAVAERLTKPESGAEHVPQAFSPDAQHLLYSVLRDGHWTLWAMNMKDKTATAFGDVSSAALVEATFSPDGKWVAYQSNGESGTSEEQTFLQPFPATGAKYLVGDGGNPYWSPKGDQLILNWGPTKSEIVPVSTTPTVALGQPVDFPNPGLAGGNPTISRRNVDSLPDGEHIVGVTSLRGQATTVTASSITVVLNWFDEVRQRVPTP